MRWKTTGRKTPYFAELVFHEINEESTRLANFQVGLLDTFNIVGLDSLPAVKRVEDVEFMRWEGGLRNIWEYLVRSMLALAPRTSVRAMTQTFHGFPPTPSPTRRNGRRPPRSGEPWQFPLTARECRPASARRGEAPGFYGAGENNLHRLPEDIRQWDYDPEKARQLLAEAGYPGGGFEITLTPSIRGVPAEVEACEAIATMWEDIGIDVKLQKIPYASLSPQIRTRDYQGANCHGTGGRD